MRTHEYTDGRTSRNQYDPHFFEVERIKQGYNVGRFSGGGGGGGVSYFLKLFFCFVQCSVAICDLVHDVETMLAFVKFLEHLEIITEI